MVDKQSNDLKKKGGGELWEENKPEKLGEKIHKSHREKLAPADERMQRSDTRLYLPADLVENILIRLPVRQLVRFQIVCKDWRSLLGQSRFIYAHLKNNSHKFLHSRDSSQIWIVENLDQSPLYFKLCDLRGEHIRGISACDGLILCNTYSGKIAIWNLQVRRWLPDREFVSFDDCCCLGRTRDMIYKVLTFNLVASRYYDSALNTLEAEICDLHSQSWKSVEMDDTWTLYRNKFVVLSLGGNSFWLACWCDNNEVFVQSFNFSTESFIPVRLPFVVKPLDETTTALSCFQEDRISLLYQRHRELTELWVTNRVGDEVPVSAWTKLFSITSDHPLIHHDPSYFVNLNNITIFCEEVTAAGDVQIKLLKLSQTRVERTNVHRYNRSKTKWCAPSNNCVYFHTLVPVAGL